MDLFGFCKGIRSLDFPNTQLLDLYEGFFADFYDKCFVSKFDIGLYLDLANTYGNNILEIACGSGRVAIPLLEKGCKLTGVDISKDMLNILERKCLSLQNKPVLICQDMCEMDCGKEFDLAILAHISLCLVKSQSERIKLFQGVFNSLREGGVFVFNYLDTPIEEMISGEKKPKYFFNPQKKSFAIFNEKITEDKSQSIINAYAEDTDSNGNTRRYIGTSTKYLLNKSIIDEVIDNTKFKRVKEYTLEDQEGLIRFQVLEK